MAKRKDTRWMASRQRRGFCPRLILASCEPPKLILRVGEPQPQTTAQGKRTNHIYVCKANIKWSNQYHPDKRKTDHRVMVCFLWLGWMGSNHRNARVKVWCLTAWLHPNINFANVLYHILFYLSSINFTFLC